MSKSLKYGTRNINLGEAFSFKQSKRAICKKEVLLDIIAEGINEGIKQYMLIFSYQGKLYSFGFENKKETKYLLGLPYSSVPLCFQSLEELKDNNDVKNITDDITVIEEFIETPSEDFISVPISSNPYLESYLVKPEDANYNLNISEEITNIYESNVGIKAGSKNVGKLVGVIILVIIIAAIIMSFLS